MSIRDPKLPGYQPERPSSSSQIPPAEGIEFLIEQRDLSTADPRNPGEVYMKKLTAKIKNALQPDFLSLHERIARESIENRRRLDNIDATLGEVLRRLDK